MGCAPVAILGPKDKRPMGERLKVGVVVVETVGVPVVDGVGVMVKVGVTVGVEAITTCVKEAGPEAAKLGSPL